MSVYLKKQYNGLICWLITAMCGGVVLWCAVKETNCLCAVLMSPAACGTRIPSDAMLSLTGKSLDQL